MKYYKLKKIKNAFKIKYYMVKAGNDSDQLKKELEDLTKRLVKSFSLK
jgi:hypothetical protein